MNVANFVIHSMLRTAYLHIETVGWGHVSDSIGSLGFIHFVLFTTLLMCNAFWIWNIYAEQYFSYFLQVSYRYFKGNFVIFIRSGC